MIKYSSKNLSVIKRIKRVFIEKKEKKSFIVQNFLKNYKKYIPEVNITYINDFSKFYKEKKNFLKRDDLFLVENKGEFLKICPGTKNYVCCGYWVIDIGNNCLYDCKYCILQCYFPIPSQIIYTNIEKLDLELDKKYKETPRLRIGTGEFTDSLILEPLFESAPFLIKMFKKYPQFFIEFKTKSIFINTVLENYSPQVILSWSLNTDFIVKKYEINTPSIEERLLAAKIASEKGFKLSFHFDPIIYYPDWQKGYLETIRKLFEYIKPENITYISLGGFRFIPELKKFILESKDLCPFIMHDYIIAKDGKMRYIYNERKEMYKLIIKTIRKYAPKLTLYFCMESEEMWQDCFNEDMNYQKLAEKLYNSTERCRK